MCQGEVLKVLESLKNGDCITSESIGSRIDLRSNTVSQNLGRLKKEYPIETIAMIINSRKTYGYRLKTSNYDNTHQEENR